MYEEIEEHFKKEYPKEGCGVIAVVKGKKEWFPITNIATNNDDFIMDSDEYMKVMLTSNIIGLSLIHI